MTKNNPCPICQAHAVNEHKDYVYEFKHGRKKHEVTGLSHSLCNACNVSFLSGEQLNSNHKKIIEFQQKLVDFISAKQVLALRETYGLTQADANKIFGGGPTAFSKYERGMANTTSGTARIMLAALNNKELMAQLAKIFGVKLKIEAHRTPTLKPSNQRSYGLSEWQEEDNSAVDIKMPHIAWKSDNIKYRPHERLNG